MGDGQEDSRRMSADVRCDRKPPTATNSFRVALWAAAVVAVLLPLVLGAVLRLRDSARRSHCHYNLLAIGVALHTYHDIWGSFPPAVTLGHDGKPWHSWRAILLSQVLEDQYRFDQPWDGPMNRKLHGTSVDILRCRWDPAKSPTSTSYLAVVGPRTVWPGTESGRFEDVTDKKSDTIMLVEVADSNIHWMEPRDITVEELLAADEDGRKFMSNHGKFHVMFVDATDGFLPREVDRETLRRLATRDDGMPVDLSGMERLP